MSTNIHIDQYISSTLEKAEWNYEDIYWEAAEKLIVEAEKKKKRRFFIWFLLLLLAFNLLIFLLGIAGTIHLFETYSSKELNSKSRSHLNSRSSSNIANVNEGNIRREIVSNTNLLNQDLFKATKKSNRLKKIKNSNNPINKVINDSLAVLDTTTSAEALVENLPYLNSLGFKLSSTNNLDLYADDDLDDKSKKKHSYFLGFNTGINYNLSSTNLRPGYFIGLYYQNNFKKKWAFRVALDYIQINQQKLIGTIETRDYDFGTFKNRTNVNVVNVQYFQLPLTIHCRFYKHNSIHAGVSGLYYLNQTNEYREFNKTELIREYTKSGVGKDIQNYDVSLRLGYENILFKRLPIGVSVNYGLIDQFKSDTIKSNNFDVRLYLFYNIFK